MFDSARRITTATGPGATTSHPTAVNAGAMNHWAWTGWMPEAGLETELPEPQFLEGRATLLAA